MTTTNLTRTRRVSVEVELSPQFLADVLTTAVEGGITYWATLAQVYRAKDGDPLPLDDLSVYGVDVHEEDDGGHVHRAVTLDTVHTGIHRIVSGSVEIAPSLRHVIAGAVLGYGEGPDAGDIDADAADVIVQAGLFGEVVYG